MLWWRFSLTFYSKVFPLFKNGQKKCPKTKTQNTFQEKAAPFLPAENVTTEALFFIFLLEMMRMVFLDSRSLIITANLFVNQLKGL